MHSVLSPRPAPRPAAQRHAGIRRLSGADAHHVVPTAGGGNDVLARIVGQKMGELLGQTVVVVNKPGAQGAIASEYVARQAPDGYTLMLGYIGTHGINPACKG